jgi:hypothetical protein
MRLIGLALAAALTFATPVHGQQAVPKLPTTVFAQLPAMRKPVLSPDGHRIVARATTNGRGRLVLLNADNPEVKPKVIDIGKA